MLSVLLSKVVINDGNTPCSVKKDVSYISPSHFLPTSCIKDSRSILWPATFLIFSSFTKTKGKGLQFANFEPAYNTFPFGQSVW